MSNVRACWCGNTELVPFGPSYAECTACGTLVCRNEEALPDGPVRDDSADYYGRSYWLEHQQAALGLPDIVARARNDLSERNLYWLKTLLGYRVPPADVLELGCAHGSFVALMEQAGYRSFGVEMSPWVVEFGQKTFGVRIEKGPVECLDLPAEGLDVIVLMDVLEHLSDPAGTMRHCLGLLKQDGLLLVQTPCFKQGRDYETLAETNDPFLQMMIPKEHNYLFSKASVRECFRRLGAGHIRFERAMFAQYDMFFAVSRAPLQALGRDEIDAALLSTPRGRFVLAMLDLARKLEESETDGAARLDQINELTALLKESEADRLARFSQIVELTRIVKEKEADLEAYMKKPEATPEAPEATPPEEPKADPGEPKRHGLASRIKRLLPLG